MVECHSVVSEEDTAAVIEKATHIAMTKDTRKQYVVVRCRRVPAGYLPREQFEERMSNADDKGGFAPDGLRLQSGGSSSSRTPGAEAACVYTASGRDGLVVDLLLDVLKKCENLKDKGAYLEQALRKALAARADDVDSS